MFTCGSLAAFSALEVSLIAAACVIVVIIAAAVVLSLSLYKIIFSRQDKNPDYKYFEYTDFNINAEDISVTYRGVDLSAKVYFFKPVEECEKVVIFAHGFGAGTASYMTEIATLAKSGFAVVAADAYGCNNSAGKNVRGFYAGAEAVIAAYIGVKCDLRLKDKPVSLVGHSWGAYSVLCASSKIDVEKVVALSAFNSPVQCISDQLKNIGGVARLMAVLLKPCFFLLNFFKFGAAGNAKASSRAAKSGVKALVVHGASDKVVPLAHSAAAKAKGGNITSLILDGKRHNPYNTVAAEDKLKELLSHPKAENSEAEAMYYRAFDWNLATEEDAEVMERIINFIKVSP